MKFSQQQTAITATKTNTRTAVALALGVLAMVALAARVEATVDVSVVNVQFGYGTDLGGTNLDGNAYSAAISPLAYTGTKWTDDGATGLTRSKTNLPDSNNNPTGIGFTFGPSFTSGNWTGNLTATLALLKNAAIETADDTLTISGLDNTRHYDIYLAVGYAGTTVFTINGTPETVVEANDASWTLGQNYTDFLGIQPSGGDIVIDLHSATGGYWVLSGFQLGEEVIPEPSIALLFGLGAGILWLKRHVGRRTA